MLDVAAICRVVTALLAHLDQRFIRLGLAARWIAVGLPVTLRRSGFGLPPGAGQVLTWGGLQGGISVARALSLPAGDVRDLPVPLTYAVAVFSVLVQGLTIGRVVRLAVCKAPAADTGPH